MLKSNDKLLEVSNIEVVYNHVILVLKGVSLSLSKGSIVALLGGNGAGKTTTIGKLASQWVEAGKRVWLVAGDTFRAAAAEHDRNKWKIAPARRREMEPEQTCFSADWAPQASSSSIASSLPPLTNIDNSNDHNNN